MKKVFVFAFGLAMTIGFSQDANAWWWRKETITCTVTESFNLVVYEWSQSYEGTKDVCKDGDSWCFTSYCSAG